MSKKKYISTPEKMYELFQEYAKYTKENPKKVIDFKGSDVQTVYYTKEVPLTLEGFSVYLRKNSILVNVHDYFTNKNNSYSDYSSICRAIREEIRLDQIEGGMAGIYNPSITQRLNGLTDKKELDHKGLNLGKDVDIKESFE